MLQPGMCSASRSVRSTWIGPPGAFATQSAISPWPGGGMFGPPTPTWSLRRNVSARNCSQCGSGRASSSMYATISPDAAASPVLRALLSPRFGVLMTRKPYSPGDGRRAVGRAVVDDDHLERGVVEAAQAVQAVADGARAVVAADDDRDLGPRPVLRERHLGERVTDRRQRGLRPPIPAGEPEVPVLDVVAAAVPLVRPREHEDARAPRRERGPDLPVEHPCLRDLPVAAAVEPDLGENQGPIAREVVEPGEVGVQLLPRFQVHVEGDDVQEGQVQVLGRGEVDVRDRRLRVFRPGGAVQPLQVSLDGPRPCQRTIGPGISLPMAYHRTAGCPAHAATPARTRASMARARSRSSRNVTCCSHGTSTITRSW